MPHMYILLCADGSYYTGSTWDLEKRLWEHQNGQGANHTRKHAPVKLVHCESYDQVADAFAREKQVQGWSRKKKEALMAGDSNELHRLASCSNESTHVGFGSAQPTGTARVGFGSAQPTGTARVGFGSAQPTTDALPTGAIRSLSGAEGSSASGTDVEAGDAAASDLASAPLSQRSLPGS